MDSKSTGEMAKKQNDKDRWVQGYLCAVSALIQMEDDVSTQARELFKAGVGRYDLETMRKDGVDEYDIAVFKKHRKGLL